MAFCPQHHNDRPARRRQDPAGARHRRLDRYGADPAGAPGGGAAVPAEDGNRLIYNANRT